MFIRALKYCRKVNNVLFRSLQPVHSREAVESTHWSQELLCKGRYLEYKDLEVLSFPALAKFPVTKKIWEIFFLKPSPELRCISFLKPYKTDCLPATLEVGK